MALEIGETGSLTIRDIGETGRLALETGETGLENETGLLVLETGDAG